MGWDAVVADVRAELAARPDLVAAGMFGSVARGAPWEHSDLDVFAIADDDGAERWDVAYLRRRGLLVHLQVLNLASLARKLGSDRGTPFFTAMAEVVPWFDSGGHLARAIAHARAFSGRASRACAALCAAVEALHGAEKAVRVGHADDGRVQLVTALRHLAAAELAAAGTFPPRDVWAHPDVAALPERALLSAAWTAGDLAPLVAGAWDLTRSRLPTRSAPLRDHLAAHGPTTPHALAEAEPHVFGALSERLLAELVAAGVLREVSTPNEALGCDEIRYASIP